MAAAGVWVIRGGQIVPKHLAPPLHRQFGTGPMVIGDCMEPTLNHADGRRYDSKRAYEKAVKAAGCEIVGNQTNWATPQKPDDPTEDIRRAVETVEARAPRKRKKRKA